VGGREVTLSEDGCNTSSTLVRDLPTPTLTPPHKGEGNRYAARTATTPATIMAERIVNAVTLASQRQLDGPSGGLNGR
jgi:hypothetical protein